MYFMRRMAIVLPNSSIIRQFHYELCHFIRLVHILKAYLHIIKRLKYCLKLHSKLTHTLNIFSKQFSFFIPRLEKNSFPNNSEDPYTALTSQSMYRQHI